MMTVHHCQSSIKCIPVVQAGGRDRQSCPNIIYSIVLCLAADERLYQCAFIWFKVRQAWCLANIKFSAVMNAPIGHLHHHLLSGQLQLMICKHTLLQASNCGTCAHTAFRA